jgi:hypothetical protein
MSLLDASAVGLPLPSAARAPRSAGARRTGRSLQRWYTGAARTQCALADAILNPGLERCCAEPGLCNFSWSLGHALREVGHLARVLDDTRLGFDALRAELDADRPVGTRIVWRADVGAHCVMVTGWALPGVLQVMDPGFVDRLTGVPRCRTVAYDWFVSWGGEGAWRDTYLTCP